MQTESTDEVSGVDRSYVVILKEEVGQLRKKVAELVFSNNRYHLSRCPRVNIGVNKLVLFFNINCIIYSRKKGKQAGIGLNFDFL